MGRFIPERRHWDTAATEQWLRDNKRRIFTEKKTRAERYADEEAPFSTPPASGNQLSKEQTGVVPPIKEEKEGQPEIVEPRPTQPTQAEACYSPKWADGEFDILDQASRDIGWTPEIRAAFTSLCEAIQESREPVSQEGIVRQWQGNTITTERTSFGQWIVKVTPSA